MAGNILQHGDVLPFAVPAGGVVGGSAVLIGGVVAIPIVTVPYAAGAVFEGLVEGAASLPKAAVAIADGATVYWDNTAKDVTTTSTNNTKIGFAFGGGATSGAATVNVRLVGYPN